MSFQTQPTPPAKGARHSGLLVLGIVVLLGGIGAGIGLFIVGGSHYENAVKNLQRAPVGCDTEFNFTGTGTFVFYTESKGKIGTLHGDCQSTGATYSHSGKITLDLTMVDSAGNDVKLASASGASYDKGGFVGNEVRTLKIDKPGKYVLSVASDDTDFAIAVGRNPKAQADKATSTAIGALVIGVVLGGLLLILGLRRKPVAAQSAGWNPSGGGNIGTYQPVVAPPVGSSPGGPPPAGPPVGQPPIGQPLVERPAWQTAPPPQQPQMYPPQPPSPQQPPPPAPGGSPWGSPHQ
jgi:hypothetical protein